MLATTRLDLMVYTPKILFALITTLLITCVAEAQLMSSIRSLKDIREQGVVMQKWENSCAAATVATVLTYGFRDPVTERFAAEKMLEQTDPQKVKTQGGFSLLDLKKFVESRVLLVAPTRISLLMI